MLCIVTRLYRMKNYICEKDIDGLVQLYDNSRAPIQDKDVISPA